MKGRFWSARTRWARRMGIRVEVNLADDRRASVGRGGLPCLDWVVSQ